MLSIHSISIFLSVYLSIYLSSYPSIFQSLYLSIFLSIFLSIYLSIYKGVYVPYGESIIAVDARPLTEPLREIDVSTELDSIYEVSSIE